MHGSRLLTLILLLAVPELAEAIRPAPLFTFGSEGTGDGQFRHVTSLALDDSSNVYVADLTLDRVQKFDSTGSFVTKWGSTGAGPGQFDRPGEIAVDAAGNVYVTDFTNDRVQKFDRNGTYLTEWAASSPTGIDVHPNGTVYTHQALGNRIKVTDANGTPLFEADNAPFGQPGNINNSAFLHVDFRGVVYQSEQTNHKIIKKTSFGDVLTEWGSGGLERSRLDLPEGMATDDRGNLYVTELLNHRIQLFDSTGAYLGVWGARGTDPGLFEQPFDIGISPSGRIYVLEAQSRRIQVFAKPDFPPAVVALTPAAFDDLTPGQMVAITWDARDEKGPGDLTIDLAYTTEAGLYGSTSSGGPGTPSDLYRIDPETAATTLIGSIGFDRVGALAAEPATGILYATGESAPGTTPVLLSIDPETGVGEELGTMNAQLSRVTDLSFDRTTGSLFAHTASEGGTITTQFFPLDFLTGNHRTPSATNRMDAGGAFAHALNNQAFLVLSASGVSTLYRTDPLSGALASVAPLNVPGGFLDVRFAAMAFEPTNGVLYAIMKSASGTFLTRINVGTGVVEVGNEILPGSMDGLAFVSAPATPIANSLLNDGSFTWTVPNVPTNAGRIRVGATDYVGLRSFDHSPPYFNILNTTTTPRDDPQGRTFLSAATPNPFVGRSAMRYGLAEAGPAALSVYDVQGRLVKHLLRGRQPAGVGSVVWDGTDRTDRRVPPGVYLARLEANGGSYVTYLHVLR